jgi:hypothetical protein
VRFLLALTLIGSAGCAKERPLAPDDLVDLTRYIFQHFDDDLAMEEALDNLEPLLIREIGTDQAVEGWRLDPLNKQDVSGVNYPKRTLTEMLGAAGGSPSPFGIADHVEHMVVTDQTFANPSQYAKYQRAMTGKGAFRDQEGVLRTVNDVETKSFGITLPYTLMKDYRWVLRDGEADTIIGRSWIQNRTCNDGGGTCLELSFSVDVFNGHAGGVRRFTATWTEATTPLDLPDDLLVAGLAGGLQAIFTHTDLYLAE